MLAACMVSGRGRNQIARCHSHSTQQIKDCCRASFEPRPLLLQSLLIEELDPAERDGGGGPGNLLLVGQIEKVLAQLFIAELVRTTVVMLGQLPHGPCVSPPPVLAESPRNCISSIIRCCNGVMAVSFRGGKMLTLCRESIMVLPGRNTAAIGRLKKGKV